MPTADLIISLTSLAGAALLLVTNRIRGDLVAPLVMLVLMLTGVLNPEEALAGLSRPVVVIIACMFIISEVIVQTGIAQRLGEAIIKRGGSSEIRLLIMLMAVDVGLRLDISPQACAMTVAIACSAAFVSPLGSPVTMIVREPGGYGFADYARVGVPLVALTLAATLLLTWFLYLR